MAALAVLPLFFDLKGRAVLVAGTSDAALWKADLLAAAGADVRRAADVGRDWQPEDLAGLVLAIADAPDEDTAGRFAAAAHAAGVLVNFIDRPAFCDFTFGAIVNRSPVVVGISTAGAAPVFGQAIRRRIETLLPRGLARWAEAAAGLRKRVACLLPDPADRRAFWRQAAERAFRDPDNADPASLMDPADARPPAGGGVTIVGAGPGGAEMLTLQAVRLLQGADVILFDGGVSPDVLDLARREAKRLLAGDGDDAVGRMVRLARRNKRVVRLLAGDGVTGPRADAERAALAAAGIAHDVVPGLAGPLVSDNAGCAQVNAASAARG